MYYRCLVEGVEEFIIKLVKMVDVKWLYGFLKCLSICFFLEIGESLGFICGKRKVDVFDFYEVFSF